MKLLKDSAARWGNVRVGGYPGQGWATVGYSANTHLGFDYNVYAEVYSDYVRSSDRHFMLAADSTFYSYRETSINIKRYTPQVIKLGNPWFFLNSGFHGRFPYALYFRTIKTYSINQRPGKIAIEGLGYYIRTYTAEFSSFVPNGYITLYSFYNHGYKILTGIFHTSRY